MFKCRIGSDIMGNIINLFKGDEQMISISDVANTFLSFDSMTHKKLQKLCYYAQALYLAKNEERLIENTEFEAWVHGPVSRELYARFYGMGSNTIKQKPNDNSICKDSYEHYFLKKIYEKYGHLTGDELEALTHSESPWLNARSKSVRYSWERSEEPILDQDMIDFYR